jgi:hypothetical protein
MNWLESGTSLKQKPQAIGLGFLLSKEVLLGDLGYSSCTYGTATLTDSKT